MKDNRPGRGSFEIMIAGARCSSLETATTLGVLHTAVSEVHREFGDKQKRKCPVSGSYVKGFLSMGEAVGDWPDSSALTGRLQVLREFSSTSLDPCLAEFCWFYRPKGVSRLVLHQ